MRKLLKGVEIAKCKRGLKWYQAEIINKEQ